MEKTVDEVLPYVTKMFVFVSFVTVGFANFTQSLKSRMKSKSGLFRTQHSNVLFALTKKEGLRRRLL